MRLMRIVLAVLAIAIVLTGCSPSTSSTEPEEPAATDTQAPADTAGEPAATEAEPELTPMGTAATSADWTITVKSATRAAEAGGATATSGNELLVITFDLTNGGTADEGVGPVSFVLADDAGTEYSAAPTGDPAFILNIEQPILAGTTREILIAYEVPAGAGPFTWTYLPFVEGGGNAPAVLEVK